jgi:hypothetical protein
MHAVKKFKKHLAINTEFPEETAKSLRYLSSCKWNPDSSVVTTMEYGTDGMSLIPDRGKTFVPNPEGPDWLWELPSLYHRELGLLLRE